MSDTTKTFIKMCDCEEIQAKKQYYNMGDYFTQEVLGEYQLCLCKIASMPKSTTIWLPHQGQLQEMVKCVWQKLTIQWTLLHSFTINVDGKYTLPCSGWKAESMEQLWLAFVLKENHNKVWGGEKWEIVA